MWFTMFSVEIDAGQTAVDGYKLLLRQIKYHFLSTTYDIFSSFKYLTIQYCIIRGERVNYIFNILHY